MNTISIERFLATLMESPDLGSMINEWMQRTQGKNHFWKSLVRMELSTETATAIVLSVIDYLHSLPAEEGRVIGHDRLYSVAFRLLCYLPKEAGINVQDIISKVDDHCSLIR